jgi:hypothetical protein
VKAAPDRLGGSPRCPPGSGRPEVAVGQAGPGFAELLERAAPQVVSLVRGQRVGMANGDRSGPVGGSHRPAPWSCRSTATHRRAPNRPDCTPKPARRRDHAPLLLWAHKSDRRPGLQRIHQRQSGEDVVHRRLDGTRCQQAQELSHIMKPSCRLQVSGQREASGNPRPRRATEAHVAIAWAERQLAALPPSAPPHERSP